jgi:hypothetical protein
MNKTHRRFEDRLGLHHQDHVPDDEDRNGPRNVGFVYSSDAVDHPRRFYRTQYMRLGQVPADFLLTV